MMLELENTNIDTKVESKSIFKTYLVKGLLFFGIGAVLAGGFVFYKVNSAVTRVFGNSNANGQDNAQVIKNLDTIAKEGDGRVNFLILGFDNGSWHKTGTSYQTDVIMLASVNPETGHTAFFSIPRDLFVPGGRLGHDAKINVIYDEAERTSPGSGGEVMKKVVGDLLDVNIHYYVSFDWIGFQNFIDTIGGVDIDVKQNLYDGKINIKKGKHHFNGAQALDYVRCRKGSCKKDFGRQERQQELIRQIGLKFQADKAYKDSKKIYQIIDTLDKHLRTDVQFKQITQFLDLMAKVDINKTESETLDYGYGKPLRVSWEKGYGYVLKPQTGNFEQIRKIVHELLDDPYLEREAARIEIQDGVGNKGAFSELVSKLTSYGYKIRGNRPAGEKYSDSVIIDYSDGAKSYTVKYLELRFGVKAKTEKRLEGQPVDILVIVGDNYL